MEKWSSVGAKTVNYAGTSWEELLTEAGRDIDADAGRPLGLHDHRCPHCQCLWFCDGDLCAVRYPMPCPGCTRGAERSAA